MRPGLTGFFNLKAATEPLRPAAQISQSPSTARGATFAHLCAYPIVSNVNPQLLTKGDADENLSGVGVFAHIGECFAEDRQRMVSHPLGDSSFDRPMEADLRAKSE